MGKPPAFQFYADDFLAGTFDMSAEEVGAYIRLLCLQWTRGGLDERAIRSIGASEKAIEYVIEAKFTQADDGTYVNERLEHVRQVQMERSIAGSKGGSKTQAKLKQNSSKPSSKAQANHQAKLKHSSAVLLEQDEKTQNATGITAVAEIGNARWQEPENTGNQAVNQIDSSKRQANAKQNSSKTPSKTPSKTQASSLQSPISIKSIDRSIKSRSVDMNEELLKKARQTANLVAMSMKPNTDKNNQLVWSVAVVDTLIDDGSAMDLLDAIDANKPTNRFAYATTWLRNRLELEKQDFAQLLQRIEAQRLLRKAKQEDHA